MATVTQIIRRRRRRRNRKTAIQDRNRNVLTSILVVAAILFLGPLIFVGTLIASTYSHALERLPEPKSTITVGPVIGPTQIFDSEGRVLLFSVQDPIGDQRTWLRLEELPDYVAEATILWEDPDFLEHTAFNAVELVDRLVSNRLRGPLVSDPSLTGRLVRNVILPASDSASVDGRAQEIALVAEINRRYNPQDVLEWHLNTNYYGNEAYGIEAAAQIYLGKSARDLTLDEAALLVAIPTAPRFNPVDDEAAARSRQSELLRQLLTGGYITQAEYERAVNTFTAIQPNAGQTPLVAPEFAQYARRQAETILNALGYDGIDLVSRGGLRITTTLDLNLYYQAECTLRTHLAQLAGENGSQIQALDGSDCIAATYLPITGNVNGNAPNTGTIVMLDAQTGEIRALVGPAVREYYQPGPTLHPFVYLAGLLNGSPNYTAASMLLDIPRTFPGATEGLIYPPQNPDGQFHGPISLRSAMGTSLLPPVVQIANTIGLNTALRNFAFPLGITSLDEPTYDLSLLERGGTVSVLEMTQAYSVFATLGDVFDIRRVLPDQTLSRREPIAIRKIEDADGKVLWEYNADAINVSRVSLLQKEAAYVVTHILADPTTRRETLGQNNILEVPRPTAVVNGITSDRLDNWTIGYTPYLVTSVRLGRYDDTPVALDGFAVNGAGPIWRAMMDYAHIRDNVPANAWEKPEGVAEALVCEISGLRPNGVCNTRAEVFISLSQAQALPEDTNWRIVEINSDNGRLATNNTPDVLRRQQVYFVPPAEAMDWWQLQNRPLPPTEPDTSSRPDILTTAEIVRPENWKPVGGVVEVIGSMQANDMDFYQVSYGEGTNPTNWFNLTGEETTYSPGTPLATWDTSELDGTYTLRLLVTNTDRSNETAWVQVIVDNIPPTLVLSAGEPDATYSWPQDDTISLQAVARDNYSISRVEFYHNGVFVGEDQTAPFGYDHQITRAGIEEFRAVAYDVVGNSTTSSLTIEVKRSDG